MSFARSYQDVTPEYAVWVSDERDVMGREEHLYQDDSGGYNDSADTKDIPSPIWWSKGGDNSGLLLDALLMGAALSKMEFQDERLNMHPLARLAWRVSICFCMGRGFPT